MATREEAGRFALVTWKALVEDMKRCWPDIYWKKLEAFLADIEDSDPSWMFVNALVLMPDLGKWFDQCISNDDWSVPLPDFWLQFYKRNQQYERYGVQYSSLYLPVVEELFPEWNGSKGDEAQVFPLDPDRVLMARQFFYMHKKFVVLWKEGSDVEVASEFWFCGCGSSAIAFNADLWQCLSHSQLSFLGRVESVGLTHSEEDSERDGSTGEKVFIKLSRRRLPGSAT